MRTRDAISLISKIREKVNKKIVSEMSANGVDKIATSHGDIIYSLLNNPKLTMADIAKKIGRDKSTVTALIDKLVKLGYVKKERDSEDTRVVYVMLTNKGNDLRTKFEDISKIVLEAFYYGVTEEEKEELIRILSKIYNNF
jgi:DNA-binding MarR family transcriptional regulator